jgi:hypothetical protein
MADVGCDEMGCGGWAGEQEETVCQLRHAQAHNMPFTYMTCNTGIQHKQVHHILYHKIYQPYHNTITYESHKLILVKPGPGVQTPGKEEDKAYVIVEGPGTGIYTAHEWLGYNSPQRGAEDPLPFPYRWGEFQTLCDAKNWVQVAQFLRMEWLLHFLCMGIGFFLEGFQAFVFSWGSYLATLGQ